MYKRDLRRARHLYPIVAAQLDELIATSADAGRMAKRAPARSKWSIGEHVEHLVLAHSGTISRFEGLLADPSPGAGKPSLIGRVALGLGRIPRGRGKAPETTRPRDINPVEITQRLTGMRLRFRRLEPELASVATSKATFDHPVFGPLRVVQWLRFLQIHHDHHGRIMRDIERG